MKTACLALFLNTHIYVVCLQAGATIITATFRMSSWWSLLISSYGKGR
jgi:hypothetical protein